MASKTFRVMTYNIWDGGNSRLDIIIKVVNDARPDLLVLTEANGFTEDNNKKLKYFSEKTGLKHYHLEKCGDGWGYHVVVLSRRPLLSIKAVKPVLRAIIVTEISFTEKTKICLVGLHLTPFLEKDRVQEIRRLLPEIVSKERVIIAGDFNSLSPNDKYDDKSVETLPEESKEKFANNNKFQYEVLNLMFDNGFTQAAPKGKLVQTVPTKVGKVNHFPCRLDHILVSRDLANHVQNYTILANPVTDKASDHYPVYADVILSKT